MKNFDFRSVNDATLATGDNWRYERIGKVVTFKQAGKVPSLRVVKTLIKLLERGNKNDTSKKIK